MFIFNTFTKNDLSVFNYKRHIKESSLSLGTSVSGFTFPPLMESKQRNLFMLIFYVGQLRETYHFKLLKGCLPQILLSPFLNNLIQIKIITTKGILTFNA